MPGSSGASSSFFVKIRSWRESRASSYSLLMVSERVGQASMHRPQKMHRA
jgi:hypothetical protein